MALCKNLQASMETTLQLCLLKTGLKNLHMFTLCTVSTYRSRTFQRGRFSAAVSARPFQREANLITRTNKTKICRARSLRF